MGVEFKLEVDNIDITKEAFEHAIKVALKKIGMAGEGFAKEEITRAVYDQPESPTYKRTGNLRDSLTHAESDTSAFIGTNVEYAPYVELGTSRMRPRPFIRPAVENHTKEYQQLLDDALRNA